MNSADLTDPVFIAKVVDFVVFAAGVVYVFQKYLRPQLVALQEAQNKAVSDAVADRERCAEAIESASAALEQAKIDAKRMVEVGAAQAERLIADERKAAQEHAARVTAHASGELERERYRVRRELLEDTVERAHAAARAQIERELSPEKQRSLVEGLIAGLERTRA